MAWPVVIKPSGGIPVTVAANGRGTPMTLATNGYGIAVTFAAKGLPVVGITNDPFALFAVDIDFVAGTAKGGTQPYGSNTNDGRLFRDPANVVASFCPPNADGTGVLVSVASAGIRRTTAGAWQSPSGTNRALWNRGLTQAATWVVSNAGVDMTTATNQTGANGIAASASAITAVNANATILQTITLASGQVVFSADIKRLVGTGTLLMTADGTTYTDVTAQVTAGYKQIFITQAAVTNPVIGFKIGTPGDSFAIDFVHLITPAVAGMNIPKRERVATAAGTVLNSQSRPSADIADAGPLIGVARGAFAFFWQGRSERPTGGFIITGATNVFCSVDATGSGGAVKFSNGPGQSKTADLTWKVGLTQINKVAGYCTAGGVVKVAANGILGTTGSGGTLEAALDHFDLFTNGSGANSGFGVSERFAMGANITFTDAQLIAMTT